MTISGVEERAVVKHGQKERAALRQILQIEVAAEYARGT
jgi:hypothetical protein